MAPFTHSSRPIVRHLCDGKFLAPMRQGCSVFVGNIDFDVPEQSVVEELSAVGKVVSFRLMYDKATGRSKGYGFCEYESPLIAETAMKTLKIAFNGRPVKINYAENDLPTKTKEAASKPLQIDSVIAAIDSLDKDLLKEVIGYLKKMAVDQPTQLKELLNKNPNLVVSVLHILLKLELVDPERVLSIINDSFDIPKLRDQISTRIAGMGEADLSGLTDDVKNRITRLKYAITKRDPRG